MARRLQKNAADYSDKAAWHILQSNLKIMLQVRLD